MFKPVAARCDNTEHVNGLAAIDATEHVKRMHYKPPPEDPDARFFGTCPGCWDESDNEWWYGDEKLARLIASLRQERTRKVGPIWWVGARIEPGRPDE